MLHGCYIVNFRRPPAAFGPKLTPAQKSNRPLGKFYGRDQRRYRTPRLPKAGQAGNSPFNRNFLDKNDAVSGAFAKKNYKSAARPPHSAIFALGASIVPFRGRGKASFKPSTIKAPDALERLLCDRPSDEKQGATATQGFSFQQWWATLLAIEMLESQHDFAIGIEVKEDVAILDSEAAPTNVEFCQIKKSEQVGAWTLKELHRQGKKLKSGKHELSTLAKLYNRRHEFRAHPTKLRFVSNVGFKVPAEDDSNVHSDSTKLDQLTGVQQNVVKSAISAQSGINLSEIDVANFHLYKTNLPLAEQELFVGGKISQLVENGILTFQVPKPTVAARFLASEIQSKAASTSYARTFSELQKRVISRGGTLAALATAAGAHRQTQVVLDEAIQQLQGEGHSFLALKSIKEFRVKVCADAADRTNLAFRNLSRALLNRKQATVSGVKANVTLGELMASLVDDARTVEPAEFSGRSLGYINALALLVLNDGIDINIFPASLDSQPKAEK